MSSDFRKVALIAAALGLIVSLYIALRSGDDEAAPTRTVATTAAAEPPTNGITIRVAVGSRQRQSKPQ